VACSCDAFIAGIQPKHDLAQTDQIPFAAVFWLDAQVCHQIDFALNVADLSDTPNARPQFGIGAILNDLQPCTRKFDRERVEFRIAWINGIVPIAIPNLPTQVNFC
jgi:hypothetical protein